MINALSNYAQVLSTFGVQSTVLMSLQSIWGFRIGELLSLRRSNLNSEGFLYVAGSKSSSGRIIPAHDLLTIPYFRDKELNDLLFTITYNQYYRVVSRFNIHKKVPKSNKNNRVTHAFRHMRIRANEVLAKEDYTTQKNFSGHKSNKGISYYLINSKLSKRGKLESNSLHNPPGVNNAK